MGHKTSIKKDDKCQEIKKKLTLENSKLGKDPSTVTKRTKKIKEIPAAIVEPPVVRRDVEENVEESPSDSEQDHKKDMSITSERDSRKEQVMAYVGSWKRKQRHAEQGWKFRKNLQTWIVRHAFQLEKLTQDEYEACLPYLKSVQGNALTGLKEKASRLKDDDNPLLVSRAVSFLELFDE